MKILIWICLLVLGLAGAEDSEGKSLGKATIITAEQLAAKIEQVSILDARGLDAFAQGNIPGSQPVDWRDWTLEYPGFINFLFGSPSKWGKVPTPSNELQEKLRMLGLSNSKQIVVVGDSNGWGEEGRIAWNLLYWGAQDVALLDGGFKAWKADSSRNIESGNTDRSIAKGNFTLDIRPQRLAKVKEVLSVLDSKDRVILDSRTPEEFEGETTQWGQERGGHIPGAILVPFKSLYEKDGTYVKLEALKEMVRKDGKGSPITYCTAGVRAALLAVLYEARTGEIAATYAGSIYEWSANKKNPLVKGHKRKSSALCTRSNCTITCCCEKAVSQCDSHQKVLCTCGPS
jgi:thiosulfate/3-mercaptopyruvate sulfurtransferase